MREEVTRLVAIRPYLTLAIGDEYQPSPNDNYDWMKSENPKVFASSLVSDRLFKHSKALNDTVKRFNILLGIQPANPEEIQELGFKLKQS